VRDTEWGR